MYKLHATEQGLLIPSDYLVGLPRDVVLRRVKDMLIIETEPHAQARERLLEMQQCLHTATDTLGALDEDEIRELVDDVRNQHACHH